MDASDPYSEALGVGLARAGIGAATLLMPRTAGRVLYRRRPGSQARVALRLFGGGEIALGVGAALAARRRAPALRGWVEAGALADATHMLTLLADRRAVRGAVRAGGMASAAVATVWGVRLADRLAD